MQQPCEFFGAIPGKHHRRAGGWGKAHPQESIDTTVARGLLAIEPPKISEEEFVSALNPLLTHLRGLTPRGVAEAAE